MDEVRGYIERCVPDIARKSGVDESEVVAEMLWFAKGRMEERV